MLIVYVLGIVLLLAWERSSLDARIRKADADPYNTVKSDRWKRENGLLK